MRTQNRFYLAATLTLWALLFGAPHAESNAFRPLSLKNKLVFTRGTPELGETGPNREYVWTMNADGSHKRRVWKVPHGYGRFGGFNRAGTQALSFNGFNLYLYDLKTGRRQRLYVHSSGWGTYINSPSFSHDGKRVAFIAGSGNGGDLSGRLYVIDLAHIPRTVAQRESARVQSPTAGYDYFEPRLSAHSQRIVVSAGHRMATIPEMFSGPWNLWTFNLDGSLPRQLTHHQQPLEKLHTFDQSPCFSPNGQQVAFVRRTFLYPRGEVNDLWLVNSDGSQQERITAYESAARRSTAKVFPNHIYTRLAHPCFSPDGRVIAFNQSGVAEGIFRIERSGSGLKRLTDGTLVQWVG